MSRGRLLFALFKRSDGEVWQAIAGGGEIGETVEDAARREAWEEARIPETARLVSLHSQASVRADCFAAAAEWGPEVHVVPEYAYGIAGQTPAAGGGRMIEHGTGRYPHR